MTFQNCICVFALHLCTFPRKRVHERPEEAHTQSVTEKISAFMLHGKKWGQRKLFLQTRRLILNATSSAWSLWRVFWDFIFSRVTMCVSEHRHFGDRGGVGAGLENGALYWTRKRRNWGGGKKTKQQQRTREREWTELNGEGKKSKLSMTLQFGMSEDSSVVCKKERRGRRRKGVWKRGRQRGGIRTQSNEAERRIYNVIAINKKPLLCPYCVL